MGRLETVKVRMDEQTKRKLQNVAHQNDMSASNLAFLIIKEILRASDSRFIMQELFRLSRTIEEARREQGRLNARAIRRDMRRYARQKKLNLISHR